MAYSRKIPSLEENASAQVAVNLCQENAFKEVALCMEKSTHTDVIDQASPDSPDPEPAAVEFEISVQLTHFCEKREISRWESAVEKQCRRLTEGLPCRLKYKVQAWMYRIALEYLSYCRWQESFFGVSRNFLMDVLTAECWKIAGRLDEQKLVERLLKDERLTVLQRYRMACVYCLHEHIHELGNRLTQEKNQRILNTDPLFVRYFSNRMDGLEGEDFQKMKWWNNLTQEEKQSFSRNESNPQNDPFVHLWLKEIDGHEQERWLEAAMLALRYGNRAAVMTCWKKMEVCRREKMANEMAWRSLKEWQKIKKRLEKYAFRSENGFGLEDSPSIFVGYFTLPSYYSELMFFFLLQMDEEEQLTFFRQAFRSSCDIILECYLDWPHQDDFIPTISRLWGIMPMDTFGKCLLTLASKYVGDYRIEGFSSLGKRICNYDYRSLLQTLWKETPEEYKRFVFLDKDNDKLHYPVRNEGKMLLSTMLYKSPFQRKDEDLFKQIFCYQPLEQRKALMRSKTGETICDLLTRKEKWSFLNLLLDECFSKEEIPSFKMQFIQSNCCREMCLFKVQQNFENWVEDLMDWSLDSDTEKTQYKRALIKEEDGFLKRFFAFYSNGDVGHAKHIINFCEPLKEKRESTMGRFIKDTFSGLIEACKWEQLDAILVESLDSDGIRRFKQDLFSERGIALHYHCVFFIRELEEVERFYNWFDLSPDEIKKVKKDTLYIPEIFPFICSRLDGLIDEYGTPLSWCLADKEMALEFKKNVEERLTVHVSLKVEEYLDSLVSGNLCTVRKAVSMKKKREKKSSTSIEEGCSSPRKRFRSNIDIKNLT
ncbi:uncharacterized protein NPIL_484611 [Nephila pilipes]|uniref:Uncharacterized protein n=1 Tax=Nephila pilipes TaxID=299642 RepID=A0A8X6U5I1_NEPPI|nr:uncharacterized protein NPIL_484611 [Nephila pilipes]